MLVSKLLFHSFLARRVRRSIREDLARWILGPFFSKHQFALARSALRLRLSVLYSNWPPAPRSTPQPPRTKPPPFSFTNRLPALGRTAIVLVATETRRLHDGSPTRYPPKAAVLDETRSGTWHGNDQKDACVPAETDARATCREPPLFLVRPNNRLIRYTLLRLPGSEPRNERPRPERGPLSELEAIRRHATLEFMDSN